MTRSSLLLSMFKDVRQATLDGISHLTKEQMFTPPVPGEHPIGAYISHIAECDIGWYETMTGEKVSDELKRRCYYAKWFDPDPNYNAGYEAPKEPLELDEYKAILSEPRELLLSVIQGATDEELACEYTATGYSGKERRISKGAVAEMMITHEAHTRGQMFLLIRMAGWKKV